MISPHLQPSEIVGLIAGFGTTFAALPDLIRMIRRQSTSGMNPTMAGILAVFQIVWIYYGVLIGSWPLVMWNIVAVVVNAVTVTIYFRFASRENRRAVMLKEKHGAEGLEEV